jgi:class 3 adenylate cyclase/tetratricopeptide (TPR) repeat protein
MRCAKCGADNREGRKFCAKCAAPVPRLCPQCGASNEPGEDFCGECAAALAQAPAAPSEKSNDALIRVADARGTENIEGERKTVTALFADIKGSMELMEDLDPEEARAIVDPALKLMIDAVHRYDGYIVQSTGDGIFALFGAPVAHEDHPQRALYAALRMQEDMRRYAERLRADKGINLQARVGVNTGEVVVRSIHTGDGHAEYTPIGHSTGLAARLQTLANPGAVVVGESLRRLAEGYFQLRPLGPARIRGVNEPVEIFEVTGLGPLRTRLQRSVGRGLTKFVGREAEMAQMRRALESARQGHGQVVAAIGEPGVGKSRLIFEFKAVAQSGCLVLEAYSVSHGKASAYLPVIDLLKSYFEIVNEDDERKRREKVNGKIITLDRTLEDTLPCLFGVLGIVEGDDPLAQLEPQFKRRRTLEAIKRVLVRESLNQPLIVIFEDLHWIDSETQALLNLLVDGLATAPILLLVNYRPEYQHQWGNKTYYTQLRLDPLGKENADEMLSALLASPASAAQAAGANRERSLADVHAGERVRDGIEALKRLIIERTEGNPFFMEEMVQALFEQGVLARNGTIKLAKPLDQIRVPVTVQAILASRIDRLPAVGKELLQTLAVLGREFPLGLIKRVAGKSEDELAPILAGLQLGEFIYEQPAVPDIEYTFKHALTQEVAYNSVLVERRRLLHERAAQTLEALFSDRLEDHLSELAHQYDRGGNLGKAVEFLGRAGKRAFQQAAHSEAVGYFTRAIDLIKHLPESVDRDRQELDLWLAWGSSHYMALGPSAAAELYAGRIRARELCEKLGDDKNLMEVLAGLCALYIARHELTRAREVAEQVLAIAGRVDDERGRATALSLLGIVLFLVGELDIARQHLERGLQGPAHGNGADEMILPTVLLLLGYPSAALSKGRDSLSSARRPSQPVSSIGRALVTDAMRHVLLRDSRTAIERAEEAFSITTHGMPFYDARAIFCRGWAMAAAGEGEEGITEMQRSLPALASGGALFPLYLVTLAESFARHRRREEGLSTVAEGLRRVEQTGEKMGEAELHRVKGELLTMDDPPDEDLPVGRVHTARNRRRRSGAWRPGPQGPACLRG